MKKLSIILFLTAFLISLSACDKENISCVDDPTQDKCEDIVRSGSYFSVDWLDTISTVDYYTYDQTTDLSSVNDDIDSILQQIQQEFDVHHEGTILSTINENAGIQLVQVNQDIIDMLLLAKHLSFESNGKFDPTIGPLTALWDITAKMEAVNKGEDITIPSAQEIHEAVQLVDYQNLIINQDDNTVFLKYPGMRLDMGGIAKGFAADKIKQYLLDKGIPYALINLGGNVQTIGSYYDGTRGWLLGIRDPFKPAPNYFCTIYIEDETLVSSGVYEREFTYDGVTYHHLLDPDSGMPFRNDLVAVSVLTTNSANADGESTMLFALGLRDGFEYAINHNIDALFVTQNHEVYVTPDFGAKIQNISEDFVTYKDLDKTPLN